MTSATSLAVVDGAALQSRHAAQASARTPNAVHQWKPPVGTVCEQALSARCLVGCAAVDGEGPAARSRLTTGDAPSSGGCSSTAHQAVADVHWQGRRSFRLDAKAAGPCWRAFRQRASSLCRVCAVAVHGRGISTAARGIEADVGESGRCVGQGTRCASLGLCVVAPRLLFETATPPKPTISDPLFQRRRRHTAANIFRIIARKQSMHAMSSIYEIYGRSLTTPGPPPPSRTPATRTARHRCVLGGEPNTQMHRRKTRQNVSSSFTASETSAAPLSLRRQRGHSQRPQQHSAESHSPASCRVPSCPQPSVFQIPRSHTGAQPAQQTVRPRQANRVLSPSRISSPGAHHPGRETPRLRTERPAPLARQRLLIAPRRKQRLEAR